MYIKNRKIGIWGLGAVGISAIKFFAQHSQFIQVMDQKVPTEEQQILLNIHRCTFVEQYNKEQFFEYNEVILPSPGIDLRPFANYAHKFITELDLFAQEFNKPIIAVTGSIGKTSITYILTQLLSTKKSVALGGNIGIAMLDLLTQKDVAAYALLEVSSFQLESVRSFAPDLAIWTSFVPNHLDRHGSSYNYFLAKYNCINFQKSTQTALAPLAIAQDILAQHPASTIAFFTAQKPDVKQLEHFKKHMLFYCADGFIMLARQEKEQPLFPLSQLPPYTFLENWVIITAALKLLNQPLSLLTSINADIIHHKTLEHRIEFCGSYKDIDFYNDSKATVMESTLGALKLLEKKPIILLLGGLSKGIDRSPYLEQIDKKTKMVICFGAEASELSHAAHKASLNTTSVATLEDAVTFALKIATPGDQILLSPGGSSYDLFAHYQERGKRFKELIPKS